MNRHVIKGRGKNRGKYLCYSRMAGLPPGGEYVWLPEQRKASRHKDPRYSGETYSTGLARKHDGYWVKLVAPRAIVERVPALRDFIAKHARREANADCYWFDGDFLDAGSDYCRECAEKLVDEEFAANPKRFAELYDECDTADARYNAAIDGGWSIEHDSPPYCETCGADLSGMLTEYGADQQIEAYTNDCAPTFDDGYGWGRLDDAIVNLSDDDPRWRSIARVVDAAASAEAEHVAKLAALAISPGMPEARTALLSVLTARAEQKAPEPSFRLWDELLAWFKVRHEETPETEATEKRLIKEAKRFAAVFGWNARWMGGLFMIEAPYGCYYWPFVVMHEQFKLWEDGDFKAGLTVGLVCLKSDDALGRDANPFEKEEGGCNNLRAQAWDAGFLEGLHEAAPDEEE